VCPVTGAFRAKRKHDLRAKFTNVADQFLDDAVEIKAMQLTVRVVQHDSPVDA